MNFSLKTASNFKKSLLSLCCLFYLSSPVFGVTAVNKTGKTITCITEEDGELSHVKIGNNDKWEQDCDFPNTHTCRAHCNYLHGISGPWLTITFLKRNDKYKIVNGSNNKPAFEPVK